MAGVRTIWTRWAAIAAVATAGWLAGCASAPPAAAPRIDDLFEDARFAPPAERIDAAQVLALSPAMARYVGEQITPQVRAKGLRRALLDALYSRSALKLRYDATVTRNAAEAFETRSGNCLSLVLMTAAFARQLGLSIQYNDVLIDPAWTRFHGIEYASGHVNLTLGLPLDDIGRAVEASRLLTIDFLPESDLRGLRDRPIDEDSVIAMYFNNRAAEALADDRVDDAYWLARAALERRPAYLVAHNTLAVVYLRHGDPVASERVLRRLLDLEPANTSALANLVRALVAQGRTGDADAARERLAAIETHPPFYFLDLGLAALQAGDFTGARRLFTREIERGAGAHEPHFWLAVANLKLGNVDEARKQLTIAIDTSTTPGDRALYAAKLDHLRARRVQ